MLSHDPLKELHAVCGKSQWYTRQHSPSSTLTNAQQTAKGWEIKLPSPVPNQSLSKLKCRMSSCGFIFSAVSCLCSRCPLRFSCSRVCTAVLQSLLLWKVPPHVSQRSPASVAGFQPAGCYGQMKRYGTIGCLPWVDAQICIPPLWTVVLDAFPLPWSALPPSPPLPKGVAVCPLRYKTLCFKVAFQCALAFRFLHPRRRDFKLFVYDLKNVLALFESLRFEALAIEMNENSRLMGL